MKLNLRPLNWPRKVKLKQPKMTMKRIPANELLELAKIGSLESSSRKSISFGQTNCYLLKMKTNFYLQGREDRTFWQTKHIRKNKELQQVVNFDDYIEGLLSGDNQENGEDRENVEGDQEQLENQEDENVSKEKNKEMLLDAFSSTNSKIHFWHEVNLQ